jgi:hypothetical protein
MSRQIGFPIQVLKDAGFSFSKDHHHDLFDGHVSLIDLVPSQSDVQKWLESKGVYIAIAPELYEKGINWNWQLCWYLEKKEWEYTFIDGEDGQPLELPIRIAGGTGWYGDNGEYPTREEALDAALQLGIKKLDPLFRNNSADRLAKVYGLTQNELLTKLRSFSSELGEWSFREFTDEQLKVIVKHLGNPFKNE